MDTLALLNNNKILWGVAMLMMNAGSKYVIGDLGKFHEKVLTHELVKKMIVFAMFFVATRDIVVSFLLCVLYIVLIDGVFHEKRKFSLVPMHIQASAVSEQEYQKAREMVLLYEKQQQVQKTQPPDLYANYLNNISLLNTKA